MNKVIQVQFESGGKSYSYFTDIEDLEVGDIVVVFASGRVSTVVVSKVIGLSLASIQKATSLVICKVDLAEFKARQKKHELVQEIKNELRSAKSEQDEMILYATLAQTSPVIAQLLEKLGEIDPSMVPQIPAAKDAQPVINVEIEK